MLHATVCYVLCAICYMLETICYMLHTLCYVLYAICQRLYAIYNVYNMLYAIWYVLYAVCQCYILYVYHIAYSIACRYYMLCNVQYDMTLCRHQTLYRTYIRHQTLDVRHDCTMYIRYHTLDIIHQMLDIRCLYVDIIDIRHTTHTCMMYDRLQSNVYDVQCLMSNVWCAYGLQLI